MSFRWRVHRILFASILTVFILDGIYSCNHEPNRAPVASFAISPNIGTVDTIFTFDASGCKDAEDIIEQLQVRWDWESDSNWDSDWSLQKIITHQFTTAGSYKIVLEVRDTGGLTDSTSQVLAVYSKHPFCKHGKCRHTYIAV